jgi:hypothetical protein
MSENHTKSKGTKRRKQMTALLAFVGALGVLKEFKEAAEFTHTAIEYREIILSVLYYIGQIALSHPSADADDGTSPPNSAPRCGLGQRCTWTGGTRAAAHSSRTHRRCINNGRPHLAFAKSKYSGFTKEFE